MSINMIDVIEKKKNGLALTDEEITFFANGAGDGSIPDYQLAALLMAIRLNGMDERETASLALAMEHSGEECDLSGLPGIPVDKHSTGGVGDTTTLILAPLVAACGGTVAKMSGRGLGHTGGTLDKLESIPGFNINLSQEQFIAQVKKIGVAVIGQTQNLAPADKTLYALRDVTSTVDSLPLIASSIMSKKLASGARGIVLDVKTGRGALMPTLDKSIDLAEAMVKIGTAAGRNVMAFITNMDEPLGSHIGNALEVKEAIDVLCGRTAGPLLDVSLKLGAGMLYAAGIAQSMPLGEEMLLCALKEKKGLEKLRTMIEMQGGDSSCCDDVTKLPQAPVKFTVPALSDGWISSMDTTQLGYISQRLGAGRVKKTDLIDPSVGFVLHRRVGDSLCKGDALATVYAKNDADAQVASEQIQKCICVSARQTPPSSLVFALVTKDGVTRF